MTLWEWKKPKFLTGFNPISGQHSLCTRSTQSMHILVETYDVVVGLRLMIRAWLHTADNQSCWCPSVDRYNERGRHRDKLRISDLMDDPLLWLIQILFLSLRMNCWHQGPSSARLPKDSVHMIPKVGLFYEACVMARSPYQMLTYRLGLLGSWWAWQNGLYQQFIMLLLQY